VINAAGHPELRFDLTAGSDRAVPEVAIVNAMANGADNNEISDLFFAGVNSVKTSIRTAYRRMGVGSRAKAVRWVISGDSTRRACRRRC